MNRSTYLVTSGENSSGPGQTSCRQPRTADAFALLPFPSHPHCFPSRNWCAYSLTGRIERLLKREARINLAEEVVHREAQSQVTVVDPQVTTSTSSTPRPLADEAITAGSESASQQRDQPNDALIIANLHPKDVLKVLAAAPSPAVADAWHDGTKVTTGQRRLILRENEASRKLTRHILDASSGCEWDEAYEAGKAWWREQDRWKPQT